MLFLIQCSKRDSFHISYCVCVTGSSLHGVAQWESTTTMEYRFVRFSDCGTSHRFLTRIQWTVCSCRYSNWGEQTLFCRLLLWLSCNNDIPREITCLLYTLLQFKLIIAQVLVVDFVAALLVDRVLQFLLGKGTLRLPSWTQCQQRPLPLSTKL